ncbi:MAG TPA: Nif3-like dinuclear metal center hexameric protein [Planctomycetaceae bacterium]|nr:Nif3-like dinuclear metal center hexameric protein [Planctomycetaceae bacterium]
MPYVAEIVTALEELAPRRLAEEWDNVGLLVGRRDASVERVLTCLTLTEDVADEAVRERAQLVVSHHPLMFRPIQKVTADDPQGRTLLTLIAGGVAVYSPHTSYDSAVEGINQQLAELFELQQIAPLRSLPGPAQLKLVTFVPPEHLDKVQQALWKAGAGVIGEYDQCSFILSGTGTFRGSENSNPTIGQAGRFETVEERRLEVLCLARRIDAIVAALRSAHPYEEPAFDIYPLQAPAGAEGSGRGGLLSQPMKLGEFMALVRQQLNVEALQYVGDPSATVRRVGIACGSGAEFLMSAKQQKCDVLLTGEARFHDCLKARDLQLPMVLPGHYATERPGVERLCGLIAARLPGIEVHASVVEADPLRWDVAGAIKN